MEGFGKQKKTVKSTLGKKLQSNLRFRRLSGIKDEQMFNCLNCLKPFKSRNWTLQNSPMMGYTCRAAKCPECKSRCFVHVPNGR